MPVTIEIDKLILNGFETRDKKGLYRELERELTRLVQEQALNRRLSTKNEPGFVSRTGNRINATTNARELGRCVASNVNKAIR